MGRWEQRADVDALPAGLPASHTHIHTESDPHRDSRSKHDPDAHDHLHATAHRHQVGYAQQDSNTHQDTASHLHAAPHRRAGHSHAVAYRDASSIPTQDPNADWRVSVPSTTNSTANSLGHADPSPNPSPNATPNANPEACLSGTASSPTRVWRRNHANRRADRGA